MKANASRHSHRLAQLPILSVLAVLIALCGSTITALAQTYRGGITGTVSDNTGAAIAGASITAVEDATNVSYKAVSSSGGEFDFTNLPVGTYTVTVGATGFSNAKYVQIIVAAGTSYTLTAKLAVSSSAETVEVTAASLTLDTTTDIQATTLPEVVVQNLPNSGRDFTQMVSQTTGFAGLSTGGGAGVASVNGTRSNSVNWQIEGTDNNDLWWNIPAVNQGGVSSIAGVIFPIDAIENFSFVTTGSVGLGRNPGGTANLTVKSGTNSLHGTAYFSAENEDLEKQNPFLSSKGESRLLDYGFSVGGPIYKNKLFFFGAGEHQNFLIGAENQPTEPSLAYQKDAAAVLAAYGVPSVQAMYNVLNGNGTLPGLYPASALTGGDSPNNYVANGDLTGHSFNGVIHLDAKLTDKDQLSAMWFVGQGTQTAPSASDLAPYFENAPIHVQNYSLIYNRLLSSSLANQLSAGVSYFNQVFGDHDTSFNPIGLGLNTGVTDPALPGSPHIVIGPSSVGVGLTANNTGFDPTGPTAPSGRNDITGHLDEDLTWTKGAHQMHFGGEIRQAQVDDFYQTGQRGTLEFDGSQGPWSSNTTSACATNPKNTAQNPALINALTATDTSPNTLALADFLAGCINPTSSSIVLGNPKRQVFVNTFALYGQDNWQVNKRLNLNYGLRYDYEGPVHSNYPNLSIFDPTQPNGLSVAGQQIANIYQKFWGAVSPRLGVAYQIDGSGKTVLRAGYGFYYDSVYMKSVLQNNGLQDGAVFGPGLNPAGSQIVVDAQANHAVIQNGVDIFPSFATAFAEAAGSGASPGSITLSTFDKGFKPSDTQLWDLNIQHSLTNSVIAQVGYVGSKGTHLLGMFDINSLQLTGTLPDGTKVLNRPYAAQFPQFGVINEAKSNLGSIYNSLQATLKVQSWHGLTSQLNYTWSHSLDYETGLLPYLPQDSTNEKAEYGNSDFDVRNTFTGYFDYTVPTFRGPQRLTKGWEANAGFSFHGGTPYTVIAATNYSGSGDGADRAFQVLANPTSGVSHAIVDGSVQWFNPAAYVSPNPTTAAAANALLGTFSPTRRGQSYNPGYGSFDLSAIKTTQITERVKFQVKANMYNLFNRANYAPVGFPSTGTGGTISSTLGPYLGNPTIGPGEPLNVEFAGKIIF